MKINLFEIYKKIRKKRSKGTQIHKDKRKKSRQQEKIDLRKEY
jgi:hypothetical protein